MGNGPGNSTRVVVVHRGARDAYQVSRALADNNLLKCLVTDLYWPSERTWAKKVAQTLPASIRHMLMARSAPSLRSSLVRQALVSGLASFVLEKLPKVPFSWRRRAMRWADASLGRFAGETATSLGSTLLAYSYYGYHAFRHYKGAGMLFQLHPHPLSVRRILEQELADHPDCQLLAKRMGALAPARRFSNGSSPRRKWRRTFWSLLRLHDGP